jgi:hypothetical protein
MVFDGACNPQDGGLPEFQIGGTPLKCQKALKKRLAIAPNRGHSGNRSFAI